MAQLAVSVAAGSQSVTLDRIVLATDFSGAAERAAAYAQGLARRYVSSLALAHVVDLSAAAPFGDLAAGLSMDVMRQRTFANLAANQHRLVEEMTSAGVRTSSHTLEAEQPAASLVRFAEGMRADLIITGTNARRGLKKVIPGSFAEGVIRHASCPVLTIGPKARPASKADFGFRSIVVATKFGPDAAKLVSLALSFAAAGLSVVQSRVCG
ncbi:MAG: universal stress protein [Acidobacteriota bacterium]